MAESFETVVDTEPANWGQIGHLTHVQDEALKHFIEQTPADHINMAKFTVETVEQVSLRFLRARQFDVIKAKELIAECFKKKTEGKARVHASMKPEECLQCDIHVLKNMYPHTMRGFDHQNRPVLFEYNGKVNIYISLLLLME